MHPIGRNILAVVTGFAVGSIVNSMLVKLGTNVIPLPEGADISTPEGLKAALPLFEGKHFIFPLLAHALGTFAGAWLAAWIAANNKMKFAIAIGVLFLLGGIAMAFMVPSPTWFTALDLIVSYLPMAYLGGKLATRNSDARRYA